MERFITVSGSLPLGEAHRHEAQLLADRTEGAGFATTEPESFGDLCRGLAGEYRDVRVAAFFGREDLETSLPRRARQAGFELTPFSIGAVSGEGSSGGSAVELVYSSEGLDGPALSRGILALVQLALRTRSDPWNYLLRDLGRGGPHTWAWQEWFSRTAVEGEEAAALGEREFRSWAVSGASGASGGGFVPDPPVAYADLDIQDNVPDRPSVERPVDWERVDPGGWVGRRVERLVEELETFRGDLRQAGSPWYLEPPGTDHRAAMKGWLDRLEWRLKDAQLTARDAEDIAERTASRARELGVSENGQDGESGGGLTDVQESLQGRLEPLARRVRERARALSEWKDGRWKRLGLAILVGVGVGAAAAAYLPDWNRLLLGVGGLGGGVLGGVTALALHRAILQGREDRLTDAKRELSGEDRRLWEREARDVLRRRVEELREEDRADWSETVLAAADRAKGRAEAALTVLSTKEDGGKRVSEADPVRQRRERVDSVDRELERLAREASLLEDFTFWTEDLFEEFAGDHADFAPAKALSRVRVAALFLARTGDRAEAPAPSRVRGDLTEGTMKDLSLSELESPDLSSPVGTVVLAPGGGRFDLDSHMVDEAEEHAVDDAVLAVSFFER